MEADPTRSRRPVMFICDEYQAFATTGENEPSGDEKFFSLARQARRIPDARFRDLHDKRGGGRHHRKDLPVHFQCARSEALSRFASYASAHRRDNWREARIDRSIFTFGGSRCRLSALFRHYKAAIVAPARVGGPHPSRRAF
jgi:hypothetical protein